MPAGQEEILYLIGDERSMIEHSPYLESARAAGHEVLLLTDPIDEFWADSLGEYKGKKLKAVDRVKPSDEKPDEQQIKTFEPLIGAMKSLLGQVKEVRLSTRMKESAACLVPDENAPSAHMERLMQRLGRGEMPESKKILELNGDHPAIQSLQALHAKQADDPRVEMYTQLLYDQALLAEGSRIPDPSAFAKRVNDLLVQAAGRS
jgi:molecular chaperone HtpG